MAGLLGLATLVFAVFFLYGRQVMRDRPPDSPAVAAEAAVRSDNTAVGLLGGVRSFRPRDVQRQGSEGFATATVEADVVGARDSGTLRAELRGRDGRWFFADGTLVLSDGRSVPIRGSPGY